MTSRGYKAADPVTKLVEELHKLPGIGPKSAQRLAYYLIRIPDGQSMELADAIAAVKQRITLCSCCANITEIDPCGICDDTARDQTRICVVEEPLDVPTLERTGAFNGLYHVLHGVIAPMKGIGPDDLQIGGLLERLKGSAVEEVVLATNPNVEGEATSMFIHNLISPLGIRVTRPARGLPVGGDIEFADAVTLGRALEGRQEF